jgi:soluble lytic murein transglycosylase
MKYLVSIVLFLALCFPVYGENLISKAYLQQGRSEIKSGRYDDAITSLTKAWKEFPLLGDYALLWLSDAYHETGNHTQSLEMVRTLLKQYPHSPLVKKARTREIQEVATVTEENIQPFYESYIKDYPADTEVKYQFARWLKLNEQPEKAKVLFKDIYRDAGSFAMAAFQELEASDIGAADLLKHASNQMKQMNHKTAEAILKSALANDNGCLKTEMLKELGLALFSQKKYREAADVYKQAGERYWEVRSLYRAGEKALLTDSLNELLAARDKRIGSILISLAADRRRDGKSEDAVSLYRAVIEKFPSEAEESLWGIGWTYFLSAEYQKASEIFTRLHSTFGGPKYLYWKNRSLELSGEDTRTDYSESPGSGTNFYSVISKVRAANRQQESNGNEQAGFIKPVRAVQEPTPSSRNVERVEYLIGLGLKNEALSEMNHISKNSHSSDDLFYLCSKFQELGEYKSSVRLASKIPNPDMVNNFLYPFAYKDIVETLSNQYDLDPFLTLSIMREESRFDHDALSPAGAVGLMQLMPGTAFRLDRKLNAGLRNSHDLTDVQKNLHLGIYYLSTLVREFGAYPQAIAAYNAGEEAVRKWLQKGNYKSADEFIEDIPYNETRNYVKRVLTTFFEYQRNYSQTPLKVGINLGSM